VIVIIGILAAVAIPKLAATRTDAKVSKIAANLSTLISDAGSYYTSQGQTKWQDANVTDITNVTLYTGATESAATLATSTDPWSSSSASTIQHFYLVANPSAPTTSVCIDINTTSDGNISVGPGGYSTSTSVCDGVKAQVKSMFKEYQFGGVGIVR